MTRRIRSALFLALLAVLLPVGVCAQTDNVQNRIDRLSASAIDQEDSIEEQLGFALYEGKRVEALQLIAAGADPAGKDRMGTPILFHAIAGGHIGNVALLLDRGVDPNVRGLYDVTPLMAATADNQLEIARLLLARGADPTLEAQEGRTAIQLAERYGHEEMKALLTQSQVSSPPDVGQADGLTTASGLSAMPVNWDELLVGAVAAGDPDLARQILARGADPNAHYRYGLTPLMFAAQNGDIEILRTLLEGHADPGIRNEMGETALHIAARGGDAAITGELLRAGAEANLASGLGYTPLMLAAQEGTPAVVQLLLDAGAEAAKTNMIGQTARQMAESAGHSDAAALLPEE